MKSILDIAYGEFAEQKLDVHLPEKEVVAVFVYFHGGGLKNGDKADALAFAPYLTARGIAVVSAIYRKYPAASYPDFIKDAAAATAWTFANADTYGWGKNIFVGGSSAGGYLSMMLCFDNRYLAAHGIAPTDVAGYIHDAGQPTCHFNVLKNEDGLDIRRVIIDRRAPIYHIGTQPAYAPMLFIVSDDDMENRYEQTVLTVSTLKHFGYDMNRVQLKVMHGTHTHYVKQIDGDGQSAFGKLIAPFVSETIA